jgi:hypothetical protein
MQPVTRRAIDALGADTETDFILRPETHAAILGPEAEQLKQILLSPAANETIAVHRDADDAAGRAQRTYKGFALLSAWTGFGAAVIGSLVLMFSLVLPIGEAMAAAAILQAMLLVVSLGSSLLMGVLKPFETWMLKRAEAENARITYFSSVMTEQRQAVIGELPLLPLQLEYFRRYQLDVQRHYYRARGRRHAAAARAAWRWRLLAFTLVLLAGIPAIETVHEYAWLPAPLTGFAASLGENAEMSQRVFLGLGIIAAALQGHLASIAVMSLDERNAARYRSTAANLDALAGRPLEEARTAAASATTVGYDGAEREARDRVLAFVALVQDQISSEHREWITLRKFVPDLALDRLINLRLPPRGR